MFGFPDLKRLHKEPHTEIVLCQLNAPVFYFDIALVWVMTISGIVSLFNPFNLPPVPHRTLFAIALIGASLTSIASLSLVYEVLRGHHAYISQGKGYLVYGVGRGGVKINLQDVEEIRDKSALPTGVNVIMRDGRVDVLLGVLARGGKRAVRAALVESGFTMS